jgi:hypothetical protein
MIVHVDGKPVTVLNNVKIIHDGIFDAGKDFDKNREVDLHLTLTYEGIIIDVIEDGEVIGTQGLEIIDILDKVDYD